MIVNLGEMCDYVRHYGDNNQATDSQITKAGQDLGVHPLQPDLISALGISNPERKSLPQISKI